MARWVDLTEPSFEIVDAANSMILRVQAAKDEWEWILYDGVVGGPNRMAAAGGAVTERAAKLACTRAARVLMASPERLR